MYSVLARKAPKIPISNYIGGTSRIINENDLFDFAVAFPGV